MLYILSVEGRGASQVPAAIYVPFVSGHQDVHVCFM